MAQCSKKRSGVAVEAEIDAEVRLPNLGPVAVSARPGAEHDTLHTCMCTAALCARHQAARSVQEALATLKRLCVSTSQARHATACSDVTSIYVSDPSSRCTADRLVAAAVLPHFPNLQELRLSYADLSGDGVRALAEPLGRLTALTYLDLDGNSIGDDGARALAEPLGRLDMLQELYLNDIGISATGVRALAEPLGCLTQLTSLNLRDNGIGDDGARALAEPLGRLTRLSELDLRNCDIGAAGACALAEPLGPLVLEYLNLAHNRIGSEGAYALAEPVSRHGVRLEGLFLENNGIGRGGKRAITKAFEGRYSRQEFDVALLQLESF